MNKWDFSPLAFVYPQRCAECSDFCTDALCKKCFKKLRRLTSYTCIKCGKPLGKCVCRQIPSEFERCVSAFGFEEACVASLIYKLKSEGAKITSDFLAKNLCWRLKKEYGDVNFDCVTYVPVTRRQYNKKGFDHAQIIAKFISKELKIPFLKSPIYKRNGIKQKYLDVENRKKNAPKMFRLKRKAEISGRILLVDDVMTTGNTFSVCAKLLKRAGASEIYCASVATSIKN